MALLGPSYASLSFPTENINTWATVHKCKSKISCLYKQRKPIYFMYVNGFSLNIFIKMLIILTAITLGYIPNLKY